MTSLRTRSCARPTTSISTSTAGFSGASRLLVSSPSILAARAALHDTFEPVHSPRPCTPGPSRAQGRAQTRNLDDERWSISTTTCTYFWISKRHKGSSSLIHVYWKSGVWQPSCRCMVHILLHPIAPRLAPASRSRDWSHRPWLH